MEIAPSGYYASGQAETVPTRRSARRHRNETLCADIRRVRRDNHAVYGARKVWRQLRREGTPVARCTMELSAIARMEVGYGGVPER